MAKDPYQDNPRSRRRPRNHDQLIEEHLHDEDLGQFARLLQLIDVNQHIIGIILFFLIAAAFLVTSADLWTSVREDTLTDGTATQTDEPPVETTSFAELEAQEPIDITDGAWSFSREGESYVLYTMDFESDGTFDVRDDSGYVQDGTYIEDGDSVEIELFRRTTLEAEGDSGKKRTEDVEYYEWFHMTRVGNTMRGSWEGTDWEFSYERGFEYDGTFVKSPIIVSRPE